MHPKLKFALCFIAAFAVTALLGPVPAVMFAVGYYGMRYLERRAAKRVAVKTMLTLIK